MPRKPPARELDLIAGIAARAQRQSRRGHLRRGIGDDCAVLRPQAGQEVVVTTDLLLENVHFRQEWHTPESAGHRCLARGLSDLAAMGAQPLAAFLSLALPAERRGAWVRRFLDGLFALAATAGVPVAGGDTAALPAPGREPALFAADIVLLGSVPEGTALLRSGARAGDLLYVTGRLGGAAGELDQLADAHPAALRRLRRAGSLDHPQLFPAPRLAQGRRLIGRASAAIDLSDGLSTDLSHLCDASGLSAEVDAARLPLHPLAAHAANPLQLALHGGEDYELLFTAALGTRIPRSIAGVPVTRIGKMLQRPKTRGASIWLVQDDGARAPLRRGGWEHFQAPRVPSR